MSQFPHDKFAKNLFELLLTMGIIVVHQLPQIPETRWFRLMGKGKVQQTAVDESIRFG